MQTRESRRVSPATAIAFIALFVALGSGAYAAVQLKANSVKSRHIANGQVRPVDLRDDYQQLCKPGAIKASRVTTSPTASTSFVEVPGFNCTGGAVMERKMNPGTHRVWFVDNPDAGSGIVSILEAIPGRGANVTRVTDTTADTPNAQDQQVWEIETFDTNTPANLADYGYSLLAF